MTHTRRCFNFLCLLGQDIVIRIPNSSFKKNSPIYCLEIITAIFQRLNECLQKVSMTWKCHNHMDESFQDYSWIQEFENQNIKCWIGESILVHLIYFSLSKDNEHLKFKLWTFYGHIACFKTGVSKVQNLGNLELSPMHSHNADQAIAPWGRNTECLQSRYTQRLSSPARWLHNKTRT